MMGRQATKRELFVMISLDEYVPEDHLLRAVDRYLDLSEFRACLSDSYSHTGRPSLNKAMMAWFFKHYGSDPKNPYALPMKADSLTGLPPATIVAAEIDPLLTEGKAYADKLKKDGVKVDYKEYSGVTHEFFGMGAVVPKAKDAEQYAANALKRAFAGK